MRALALATWPHQFHVFPEFVAKIVKQQLFVTGKGEAATFFQSPVGAFSSNFRVTVAMCKPFFFPSDLGQLSVPGDRLGISQIILLCVYLKK